MLFNPRQRPFSRVYHRAQDQIVLCIYSQGWHQWLSPWLAFFHSPRIVCSQWRKKKKKERKRKKWKKSSQGCVLCDESDTGFGLDHHRRREAVLTMNVWFERGGEGVELLNCPIIILTRQSSKIQVRDDWKLKHWQLCGHFSKMTWESLTCMSHSRLILTDKFKNLLRRSRVWTIKLWRII